MKILLAGILGGIAMFICTSIAHLVLPLGEAGVYWKGECSIHRPVGLNTANILSGCDRKESHCHGNEDERGRNRDAHITYAESRRDVFIDLEARKLELSANRDAAQPDPKMPSF